MAKNKSNKTTDVESIRHKDRRVNIPTEELRDFVVRDEASPKTILYPRDPSLDPQLVWKGKDEQDMAEADFAKAKSLEQMLTSPACDDRAPDARACRKEA